MFVASYTLIAGPEGKSSLESALGNLAAWLGAQPGCEGAQALRHSGDSHDFLLLEFWRDEEARNRAGATMDKALMAAVKDSLGAPPAVHTYQAL